MAIVFNKVGFASSCNSNSSCLDKFGCPSGVCPDFSIRRHDTKPPFKVSIADCDGPIDLRGLVIEVNMWAKGKLRDSLEADNTYFRLADNIGFEQIMVGDIIVMDRVRNPERMLVEGFDEENYLVQVQRAYHGTTASNWKKGSCLKVFRVLNGIAQSEMVFEDVLDIDGTVEADKLIESFLVYEWQSTDTCLPGCYWLEFKVLKMLGQTLFLPGGEWDGEVYTDDDGRYFTGSSETDSSAPLSYDSVNDVYLLTTVEWTGATHIYSSQHYTGTDHDDGSVYLTKTGLPRDVDDDVAVADDDDSVSAFAVPSDIVPSFTDSDLTPADFGCSLGEGVESVRRYPLDAEGFLIKIYDSPTAEI